MRMDQPVSGSSVQVSEVYWSLVEKADKKFSKIRDVPYYERNRYDTYFCKVFKVYTNLWKFQQVNRQKLVEAGIKRWEIGEIASRIAQLYYGQYMRTSDASYLSESYVFYEAILNREYFKEGIFQNLNLMNKQLRFLARFLMVCLVMNRREMIHQVVSHLKIMLDECRRTFQDTDFKEWKIVVQEISRFLKADSTFMNIRPLRYSVVLDPDPDALPKIASKKYLRLRDAILCSYYHNEIKFSDLSLDAFRILQCLEWEPSGSFYQSNVTSQTDGQGASSLYCLNELSDHTLPANPRKAMLYHPSATRFLAVLGMMCEELPSDGILLIYLSASVRAVSGIPLFPGGGPFTTGIQAMSNLCQSHPLTSDHASSPSTSPDSQSRDRESLRKCLHFGMCPNGVVNSIYPSDLIPFTRRPLFIIIDSDGSDSFKIINEYEKGEPAAMLLSPICTVSFPSADSSRYQSGSMFTTFLTAPLQAFYLLLGLTSSDIDMETFDKAEKLLSSSLASLDAAIAASDDLDPVWSQSLGDPFLRRILLRFVFCRSVLALHETSYGKKEFHPECLPPLPACLLPTASQSQVLVLQLANHFDAAKQFIFSEELKHPDIRDDLLPTDANTV